MSWHYAKSGDVHIAYQINGDGPFDMVLTPGTFSHLDMDWDSRNFIASFWFDNLTRPIRVKL